MHTIIDIYFAEQYSYAPERGALPHTPPLQVYAEVDTDDRDAVDPVGARPATRTFGRVMIPQAEQINMLQGGEAFVVWNGGRYAVTGVDLTPGDQVVAIQAQYQDVYDPPVFDRFVVGDDAVIVGDDQVGVGR